MASADEETRISIDFIDPLFAVVLHLSFAQILLEIWFERPAVLLEYPHRFEVACLLLVGYVTVILSWVGYHRSILAAPILVKDRWGFWRFILDIVLLFLYFILLVGYKDFARQLVVLALIFVVFVAWDQCKRLEWPERDDPRRRGVTMFWCLAYIALACVFFFAQSLRVYQWWWWFCLTLAFSFTFLYRLHKNHPWPLRFITALGFPPTKRAMRIYVAGPYTAAGAPQMQANTDNAIDAGMDILKKGHFPFIPHLTHFVEQRAKLRGIEISWDDYIAWDSVWLDQSDALLYLGSSRGADIELARAQALGKKIFRSTSEIPDGPVRQ